MHSRATLLLRMLPALAGMARLRGGSRRTATSRLEELARTSPDHPFVLFEERRISYAEMNERANRVAHWGSGNGWGHGDVVALLMENRPEYLEAWMGLAKLGVTTALVNTHLSGRALAHTLQAADTRTLILGAECGERFAGMVGGLGADVDVWIEGDSEKLALDHLPPHASDLNSALAAQPATNPPPPLRGDLHSRDNLFYIYTSGTTGLPKAARFSHQRFLQAGNWERHALRLGTEDVHYCALPLYHSVGGAMVVSSVLAAGATLALRRHFSAEHFWDDVRRFDATCFQYVGEICRYLLNQPPRTDDRDHHVRAVMGNGMRPELWETFQRRFGIREVIEYYGATEGNTAIVNLENRVGSIGRYPFKAAFNGRLVRYDHATEAPVRDERGRCIECQDGEIGELIGRVRMHPELTARFEGYTSEKDTARKILRDVFSAGDSWFRTGDLMRQDADGFFYFVDRIGDTFRWKGENVSTQELESALGSAPGVSLVNVYGVAIEGMEGRAGMAALLFEDPTCFDGKAFYRLVEDAVPRYAAPCFLRLIREVEITGTFKVRKNRLREEGFDIDRIADPLLFRDDEARAYVPLTRELLAEIQSGTRKL